MDEIKLNGAEVYKQIAGALPYELKSALLAIRDDGVTFDKMPTVIYFALYELQLIETVGNDIKLSRAGEHLVNYCTC